MTQEKNHFLKNVTFIYDTREKKNFDLLKTFAHYGVKTRQETFATADYTFEIDGKSYKNEWLGERKGSLSEIYGNVVARDKGTAEGLRNNLEEEAVRAKESGVCEFIVFLQGAENLAAVKAWKNPKATKQGERAGEHIYSTLLSWGCNNRYGIKVECGLTQADVAVLMLEHAFYYWRNDMRSRYGKDFLKRIG